MEKTKTVLYTIEGCVDFVSDMQLLELTKEEIKIITSFLSYIGLDDIFVLKEIKELDFDVLTKED